MANHREATEAEVLKAVRIGRKMSYRHFLMELPRINAKNGVMHRQRSTGTIILIWLETEDGIFEVMTKRGETEAELAAHYRKNEYTDDRCIFFK